MVGNSVRCYGTRHPLIELTQSHTNCGSLSVNMCAGIPNGTMKRSRAKFALFVDVVLVVEMACVILECQSVIKKTDWFLNVVFGCGPNISMVTYSSSPVARNSFIQSLK